METEDSTSSLAGFLPKSASATEASIFQVTTVTARASTGEEVTKSALAGLLFKLLIERSWFPVTGSISTAREVLSAAAVEGLAICKIRSLAAAEFMLVDLGECKGEEPARTSN